MPDGFTVKLKNEKQVKDFFKQLRERYTSKVWAEGAKAGLDSERDVIKARAPNWMGHLFDSIQSNVQEGSPVFGILESTSKYATHREFGTVRHFVPAKYIGDWAKFHIGEYTGLVVSGEATPFFRESETQTLKDVAKRVGVTVVTAMIDWFKSNNP